MVPKEQGNEEKGGGIEYPEIAKRWLGDSILGLEGADSAVLPNLLTSDPMDPAIEIMADVRAYFQGP